MNSEMTKALETLRQAIQETEGYRKYSLRSVPNGGIDVSEIAAKFGGGGHKHAAGFKIALSDLVALCGNQ